MDARDFLHNLAAEKTSDRNYLPDLKNHAAAMKNSLPGETNDKVANGMRWNA